MGKTSYKSVNKYMKRVYDRITITPSKEDGARYRAHAEKRGESMNSFINRAIKEQMRRDDEEDAQ